MPSRKMESGGLASEDNIPQSLAFTVHFDSAKTTNSKFIKKHIRNLSLPITKVYDNRCELDNSMNGRTSKRQGNHSEGYFSSDPDEEHPPSRSRLDFKSGTQRGTPEGASVDSRECDGREGKDDEDGGSDVASETGTYTIERESPEVITARLSIDTSFGVDQGCSTMTTSRDSTSWINDWASQIAKLPQVAQTVAETTLSKTVSRNQVSISKIPSPLATRARFGAKNVGLREDNSTTTRNSSLVHRNKMDECSDSETERILKTTEKVMTALAARLSVDSGGESDSERPMTHCTSGGGMREKRAGSCGAMSRRSNGDTASPIVRGSTIEGKIVTSQSTSTTRYNRAFSLRRGRLDTPIGGPTKSPSGCSPPPSIHPAAANPNIRSTSTFKRDTVQKTPQTLGATPRSSSAVKPVQPTALSRTDTGRFSMRSISKPSPQSPLLSSGGGKKPAGVRSNSTLSSKEVEFQNWKRRKSYDPMKAAAEGRKKDAATKKQTPTTAITTPKSPVNSVWRSASFHGTRQLVAGGGMMGGELSSSEDDDGGEENIPSVEEDWPVPQGPKTSLQNSPEGSKGSLYSNSSNNSPHARQNLEGVDILLVSALYRLANKQKGIASTILKKLRCLYDEESHKYKIITTALEQLEQPEPGTGSPHMSPSRELASTLTVSKKLGSTFTILNEVLFDEVDFE